MMKRILKYFVCLGIISFIIVSCCMANRNLLYATFFKSSYKIDSKPKYVRGIHITPWSAGSLKYREKINKLIENTGLNTIVIAVKEYNGEVYIPDVTQAIEFKAYVKAMPDIKKYLETLQDKGVYTVARIVVFKDDIAARKKPEWAVETKNGEIWQDRRNQAWLDPYNRDNWEYTFSIADKCVELGFDELQFDYIRFPSDGVISNCKYSVPHSSTTAVMAICAFLQEAQQRYKTNLGVPISIDVFGLTTSADDDMGIGQIIVEMEKYVDYICPMVYPSHYAKNTYGLADPDSQPYETINIALIDAKERLGENISKLRPYLQDFTVKYRYGKKEILDQIKACADNGIFEWTLWNPRSAYTDGVFDEDK
ncbi:MAG: putative glycoside hydrolase [Elusimicrobiota bacterium]